MTETPSSGDRNPEHEDVLDAVQSGNYPPKINDGIECLYCTKLAVWIIKTPWGMRPTCDRHYVEGGRL